MKRTSVWLVVLLSPPVPARFGLDLLDFRRGRPGRLRPRLNRPGLDGFVAAHLDRPGRAAVRLPLWRAAFVRFHREMGRGAGRVARGRRIGRRPPVQADRLYRSRHPAARHDRLHGSTRIIPPSNGSSGSGTRGRPIRLSSRTSSPAPSRCRLGRRPGDALSRPRQQRRALGLRPDPRRFGRKGGRPLRSLGRPLFR